jgi:hypothetical protein
VGFSGESAQPLWAWAGMATASTATAHTISSNGFFMFFLDMES